MAKNDFDSLLNSDDARKGDRVPKLPDVEGTFDVDVLTFKMVEGETAGKMYVSEFLVTSSNHDLVLAGSKYCRIWYLEGNKFAAPMAAKKMRPYLAACVGAGDPQFDAVSVKNDLIGMTERGEKIGAKVRITTRFGKPNEKKLDDAGKPKRYIEDTYVGL
jgi:hypothetical protein